MPDSESRVLPEFAFAMSSHRGRRRKSNEDWCAALPACGAFLVCDGMGGAASGEIASRLACDAFLAHIATQDSPNDQSPCKPSATAARLRQAIAAANRAVYRKSEEAIQLRGMGTTLVAALLHPCFAESVPRPAAEAYGRSGRLMLGHVGDSRCYRFREGHLEQITADHSLVEDQVRAGQLTRDQASHSPMRHIITRAVGSQAQAEPEIQSIEIFRGDLFLLASDGLNRELTEEEIESMLPVISRPSIEILQQACDDLIEAANAHGGRDNVTVLLLAIL